MADHVKGDRELQKRLTAIGLQDGRVGSRILRKWQINTVKGAKVKVRRRSSHLGMSIHPGAVNSRTAQVEASAPYAAAIEFGAKPHIIVPRNARMLAWSSNRGDYRQTGSLRKGAKPDVFARLVHHPGNRPYPYLMPAAREALDSGDLVGEIVAAWNGAA